MKIIRMETGRYESAGILKGFSMEVDSQEYGALVMALREAIDLYEKNGWTEKNETLGEVYIGMKSAHEKMTDYANHPVTFNGKKAQTYSARKNV